MSAAAKRYGTRLSARRAGRTGTRKTNDGGFTLLELLIALTLLAALSAVMFGGLSFGTRAWERSEAAASETGEIAVAQNFLRRQLTDAYPLRAAADPTRPTVYLEGGRDRLQFLGPAPAALAAGGKGRFAIVVAQDRGRNELRAISRFELASDEAREGPPDATLLSGIDRAEFSYFGRDPPSDPPTWHESWSGRPTMPALIRIAVYFPPGDRRQWPELVVAPRISVDANCLWDPVIRRCRGR